MKPEDLRCETCAFWQHYETTNYGQCRAHSPSINRAAREQRWPESSKDEWCGEWRKEWPE